MKLQAALIPLCLFVCFPACSEDGDAPVLAKAQAAAETAPAKEDCANCPDAAQVPATPAATAPDLVKGFTLQETTPISKIMAAFADFEGKRVLVKGEAVAVCEKKGCWVTLKSDADASKALRVKVEDGEIVFPMTVKGSPIEAEGIIEKVVTPEAAYRKILADRAKAANKEFDPASVKGDLITWQLRGLAARW